jgi:hypothetical protein
MDKTVREKMIKEIINNIPNWDTDEIVKFCQELAEASLPHAPDELIEEMYSNIGGESIN